jgi:hypothetical protein
MQQMIHNYTEYINEGKFKDNIIVGMIAMSLLNSCQIFKHHKHRDKEKVEVDNKHWVNGVYGRHYDGEEDGEYVFIVNGTDGSWIRKIELEKYKKTTKPKTDQHKPLPQIDVALSNEFSQCCGKLPWPVDNGTICDRFGIHQDKINPKVALQRSGIYISTKPNSQIHPVFNGTVSKIFNVCGEITVIITHGNYYTVYSGFANVGKDIKVGRKVNTKALLGASKDKVDFQIWVNKNGKAIAVDPEKFLAKSH